MESITDEASLRRVVEVIRRSGTDTQTVEAKSCIGGLTKDLARTISAFSNGSGGTLVLGVDERKGFAPAAGFDVGKIQDTLSSMCMEKLEPIVRPIMDARAGMPAPVPEDLIGYFRLTLVARGDGRAEQPVAEATSVASAAAKLASLSSLDAEQRRIVEAVRELESPSITELARRLSVPRSTLSKCVAKLVEQGVLKPTQPGSSPKQRYILAR